MGLVHRIVHTTTSKFSRSDQQRQQQYTSSNHATATTSLPPNGQCRIFATSASSLTQLVEEKKSDHPLCVHRKGFFDHLKPKAFVTNTIRVVVQQGTVTMASYMSEQLELDMKRNELVASGKLSQEEADDDAEEWEQREWEARWKDFPTRVLTAFAKYHVITLVMRLYEHIAAQWYDVITVDKLTMDPCARAKMIAAKSSSSKSDSNQTEIAKEMFHTTFWGHLIAFLADYSVHQVILCYGYYVYVRERRKRKSSSGNKRDDGGVSNNDSEEGLDGAILTSMLKKSTQLMLNRGIGLMCSSVGGAVGSVLWPGTGTLLFSSMGEGAASVVMDDGMQALK